jgi:hypothetical protein
MGVNDDTGDFKGRTRPTSVVSMKRDAVDLNENNKMAYE